MSPACPRALPIRAWSRSTVTRLAPLNPIEGCRGFRATVRSPCGRAGLRDTPLDLSFSPWQFLTCPVAILPVYPSFRWWPGVHRPRLADEGPPCRRLPKHPGRRPGPEPSRLGCQRPWAATRPSRSPCARRTIATMRYPMARKATNLTIRTARTAGVAGPARDSHSACVEHSFDFHPHR
jgi:hypothetical protein